MRANRKMLPNAAFTGFPIGRWWSCLSRNHRSSVPVQSIFMFFRQEEVKTFLLPLRPHEGDGDGWREARSSRALATLFPHPAARREITRDMPPRFDSQRLVSQQTVLHAFLGACIKTSTQCLKWCLS